MADTAPHAPASATVGVVYLGMGGPSSPSDVERFLVEMFSDRAILPLPDPIRPGLAALIARKVSPRSKRRYGLVGGSSPAHAAFAAQVRALEDALGPGYLVRHAFRYSDPRSADVVPELIRSGADLIVALPSFPQYSLATTGTSLSALREAMELCARGPGAARARPVLRQVHSYPDDAGFIRALSRGVALALAQSVQRATVVMTAHSMPKRSLRKGDPYIPQVGATARALAASLPAGTRWELAFQSRESPVGWVGPTAVEVLRRLAGEGVRSVVVVPLSFTSESVETLVELDLELREQAAILGIGGFMRVPAPGLSPDFIEALARLVRSEAGHA